MRIAQGVMPLNTIAVAAQIVQQMPSLLTRTALMDLGLKMRIRTFIGTLIRLPLYPLNPDCPTHSGSVATPSF